MSAARLNARYSGRGRYVVVAGRGVYLVWGRRLCVDRRVVEGVDTEVVLLECDERVGDGVETWSKKV
jgi:hypothetical protein